MLQHDSQCSSRVAAPFLQLKARPNFARTLAIDTNETRSSASGPIQMLHGDRCVLIGLTPREPRLAPQLRGISLDPPRLSPGLRPINIHEVFSSFSPHLMLVHPADQAATSRVLSQDGCTMPQDGGKGELCATNKASKKSW